MPRKLCITVFLSGVLLGALLMVFFQVFPPVYRALAGAVSLNGAERSEEPAEEAAPSSPSLAPIGEAPMCKPEAGFCLSRPN